jgi:hypothetical protein
MIFLKYRKAENRRVEVSAPAWKGINIPALIITLLFHPLLLFFYSSALLMYFRPELKTDYPDAGFWLFVCTVLTPLAVIFICRITGIISSLHMQERSDRHLPHLFTFLIYLAACCFFKRLTPLPTLLAAMLAGTTLCLALIGIATLFWKISSHMAGIGGFTAFFSVQYFIENQPGFFSATMVGLLLSLLIAASRYQLKAHSPEQLLAGFFLGFVSVSFSVCFFAQLF